MAVDLPMEERDKGRVPPGMPMEVLREENIVEDLGEAKAFVGKTLAGYK